MFNWSKTETYRSVEEPPKKNGVVITPEEPRPATYEFFREGVLLGTFEKRLRHPWTYWPRVMRDFTSVIHYHEGLTQEECFQIAEQLRILNEQSTKEGA